MVDTGDLAFAADADALAASVGSGMSPTVKVAKDSISSKTTLPETLALAPEVLAR